MLISQLQYSYLIWLFIQKRLQQVLTSLDNLWYQGIICFLGM